MELVGGWGSGTGSSGRPGRGLAEGALPLKIKQVKKITGLGYGCRLWCLPPCQLWDCAQAGGRPQEALQLAREDCKPLWHGAAPARKAAAWPRIPAPCPGNGPPPPSLATGAASPAAAGCTQHGPLIRPAYLQAFFLEV